jgi:hypothetical protein
MFSQVDAMTSDGTVVSGFWVNPDCGRPTNLNRKFRMPASLGS